MLSLRKIIQSTSLIAAATLLSPLVLASEYQIVGDCGGFPKVNVQTAPGFCVGLVYDGFRDGNQESRKFRWATEVQSNILVLSDMKHWGAKEGKLYLLNLKRKPVFAEPLLTVEKTKAAN